MSALVEVIAKKALKNAATKNINSKDPFFEDVPIYGRDGRPTGKVKKQKKGVPAGLSEKDAKVLKKVRRRAYRLDMSLFNCCGIRFGWSSVVGFIPVIGDFIDVFMAYMVVQACRDVDGGLPTAILSRMYFNIIVDFAVGLVPFVGDIADAIFRANTRNAWILEEYLTQKAEEEFRRGKKILNSDLADGDSLGSSSGPRTAPQSSKQSKLPRGGNGAQDSYLTDQEMGVQSRDERQDRRYQGRH
ncbi:PH domain containing protein [Grosmannia clavigera kw1407]|uniref:PH domain containing protein n=1 Tax=Grosmannia clavigera (strain kw1407 / UAMH 11150) TaxID=655863 RepID=F0XUQ5_GROCL|nr:PH domain containing protein [Grosmannia clavigera kw1407]EFW98648.1 PH domain containing protein [Grosmannia clavigera kw1407]